MRVDFAFLRDYWLDHMIPVHDELARRGHEVTVTGTDSEAFPGHPGLLTVVASSSDKDRALKAGRRVVLMEHGAAQSYSNRHEAHVGGHGRHRVELCLLPNHEALERHQRYYDRITPGVVIGSPRVEFLRDAYAGIDLEADPPLVAMTWHFRSSVSVEAEGAWPQLGPAIVGQLCTMRDLGWIDLAGSAHPKQIGHVEATYDERAIPIYHSFESVCASASVLLCDNSSALFEFAALDRPVIVVDSPRYRRNRNHGLRFWWAADVGVRIGDPADVVSAVVMALQDPPEVAEQRRRIIERVYPIIEGASAAAADAIEALGD